ncbi:hypothetical protein GALMADRAFT_213070 [Galerina marginata CBS 339.88]|uniref:F-box domain-containing protein n=1 Tax=Galerina marginata (strain CBS 339.88) TaxID=685588 RepID=A0A067SXW4_GALM3|nr:hypothetical protein GALMADRAFT_213070 [Galerina marginata CBS 339.88]
MADNMRHIRSITETSETEHQRTHTGPPGVQFVEQPQSPIFRLPFEMLQEIFIETLEIYSDGDHFHQLKYSSPSWAISQVCQLWRNTALCTSTLWRRLPTVNLEKPYSRMAAYLEFLSETLKRSGATSINVYVYGCPRRYPSHPALDILTRQSARWQKLELIAPHAILRHFEKVKGRLMSLQTLSLSLSFYGPESYISDIFKIAPKLENVFLDGPIFFRLPTAILHCSTGPGYTSQTNQAPTSFSPLRKLELRKFKGRVGPIGEIFPSLTSLKVEYANPSHGLLFLDSLTLPAVEILEVKTCEFEADLPNRVLSMVRRSESPCLLQILSLECCGIYSPGQVATLLRSTPLLYELTITLPGPQDILALAHNTDDHPLVPLLKKCTFRSPFRSIDSDETISALELLVAYRGDKDGLGYKTGTGRPSVPLAGTDVARLDSLCISFRRRTRAVFLEWNQCQLEGWTESDISKQLREAVGLLRTLLPEIKNQRIPRTRKRDFKWKDKVWSALDCIEDLKVANASDIFVESILLVIFGPEAYDSLYRITIFSKDGDAKHIFSRIARRILDKWDSVLEDSLKNMHWVVRRDTLMYLSKGDALWSKESAANILYLHNHR